MAKLSKEKKETLIKELIDKSPSLSKEPISEESVNEKGHRVLKLNKYGAVKHLPQDGEHIFHYFHRLEVNQEKMLKECWGKITKGLNFSFPLNNSITNMLKNLVPSTNLLQDLFNTQQVSKTDSLARKQPKIMPEISRFLGIVIYMYFNDHTLLICM